MDEEEKVKAMEKELEELRPLKDSSAKLQEEYKSKEEAWQKEKTELEQAANPNWKKAREQISKLQEAVKEKGVKLDDEGLPLPKDHINPDELVKSAEERAAAATRQEFLNNRLEELLEGYTQDQAKVIRHYYSKITTGEEVSLQNIREFVTRAEAASGFEKPSKMSRAMGAGGSGPRNPEDTTGLSDDAAKSIGELMGIRVTPKKK